MELPVRFEIEVELNSMIFEYVVAFEFPDGFKEHRVLEEKLSSGGRTIYTRTGAQVSLAKSGPAQDGDANFRIDWHLVALPIVQERSQTDPIFVFKQWLNRMLILSPIPGRITGESSDETLAPNIDVGNFGDWFAGLLAYAPAAYSRIDEYLRHIMPDLKDIRNPASGKDSRSLVVQFESNGSSLNVPFEELSDGEKCFMICALVVASNAAYGPLFCFWDEPENHIGISEVGHLVTALRKAFSKGGQFIATSHNPEAIQRFSDDNTLFLERKSHLEPTVVRALSQLQVHGDLVDALIRGDVEASA